MIYTCTMNPAIDLFVEMDNFVKDVVNRSKYEEYQPNGKGINVSLILKQLNCESVSLGFLGGFSGDFIKSELDTLGIGSDFIQVDGITRINTFVQSDNGEYKIVNRGPEISAEAQQALIAQIKQLTKDDCLFVSGSLPRGVDRSILTEIGTLSRKQGFKMIWDISDPVLKELALYKPYLIKPNIDEFQDIFMDGKTASTEEIINTAKEVVASGVENIIISNGSAGAWFINKETVIETNAPKGTVVNTACSGDTMLATFYAVYNRSNDAKEALKTAVAAGSSTAFRPGLTDFSDVDDLKHSLTVKNFNSTGV